jgi:iron(III) transport system substrate-binding protein
MMSNKLDSALPLLHKRRWSMKRISQWFLVLGLMVALVFSACASPTAPAPAPERPSAAESAREQKLIEAAKANGESEVVLWTMSWRVGPVEEAFEAKYPFLKLKVWDGSVKVESKLLEEYKAGMYTPDVVEQPLRRAVRMQGEGVFQEYEWSNVVGWPHQPPHRFWIHHLTSPYLPVYNTKLVSSADVPKSWEDLNDSKWEGKSIISMSGGDWMISYMYNLGDLTAEELKWDRAVNFWKEVVKTTKPQIGRGFKEPVEKLVIGDVSIMLVASGTVPLYEIRKGSPVDFTPFKVVPTERFALALTKHPPHPNAAQLLLDFLTTEQVAMIHAESTLPAISYHPKVSERAYANRYFVERGMEITQIPIEIWKPEHSTKSADFWVKEILGVK